MTDDEVRTIEQLLDKKLSPLKKELGAKMDAGFNKVTEQVDTVARHLAETKQSLKKIESVQSEQSDQLDNIDRTLAKHVDRFDDHGKRIEVLEAKTAHLPSPTATR